MHGEAADGNEPFILLYNPALEPKGPVSLCLLLLILFQMKIDVIDVAATLSLYFEGVDIPANSLGLTHSYWGMYFSLFFFSYIC